ncbi:MAG: hypothetical protein JNM35_12705 [Nitrospira sp.]|nr:hypothetical protein [Nitrospira sp.]MCS6263550.1 hypothetical protein [Nitrospira sp.]
MKYIARSAYPNTGIRVMLCFGLIGLWGSLLPMANSAESGQRINPGEGAQLRDDAEKLLKGNRSVLGKVLAITSDQIKVDIGEVQPRFLPLKQAQQKGFPGITEGDDLIVVLNAQNLLVDYHPLDGQASAHTIIRGEIAQNLLVGQEQVVIKSAGKELSFTIRSQVRSKVAAIPVGVAAVFLIDETNQIADVGLSGRQTGKQAERLTDSMPPIKGAHKQIDGTVTSPLRADRITVRTANGSEKPFEVRELIHSKLAALRKGDAVILLLDTENKVIDVAVPPPGR